MQYIYIIHMDGWMDGGIDGWIDRITPVYTTVNDNQPLQSIHLSVIVFTRLAVLLRPLARG